MRVAAALALALLAVPFAASAKTIVYAGKRLVIEVPEGYCELGNESQAERDEASINRALTGKFARFALSFVDCDELMEARDGRRVTFERAGGILLPLVDGQELSVPFSRADFLRLSKPAIATATPQSSSVNANALVDRASSGRIKLLSTQIDNPRISGDAVYVGYTMRTRADGKTLPLTNVEATTVVNHLLVMVAFGGPDDSADAGKRILTQTKAMTGRLIALNEGGAQLSTAKATAATGASETAAIQQAELIGSAAPQISATPHQSILASLAGYLGYVAFGAAGLFGIGAFARRLIAR